MAADSGLLTTLVLLDLSAAIDTILHTMLCYGSSFIHYLSTALKLRFSLLALNPPWPNFTASHSPLTAPLFLPPPKSRVWVSSSTAHYHLKPTSKISLGLHTSIYVISSLSAHHPKLIGLPSLSMPWSPTAKIIVILSFVVFA